MALKTPYRQNRELGWYEDEEGGGGNWGDELLSKVVLYVDFGKEARPNLIQSFLENINRLGRYY